MCVIATINVQHSCMFFFFNDTATTEIYTLSLHDALPILGSLSDTDRHARERHPSPAPPEKVKRGSPQAPAPDRGRFRRARSEEHTSELQSRQYLVCRLLLEKKKIITYYYYVNKTVHDRDQ